MAVIWTHWAHSLNSLIWRYFLNPWPDRNITGSPMRRWAQMVQARHNTWKYKLNENETISFTNRVQIYEINLQNFTIDGLKFEIKRSYIYSNYHQFWSFSTGRTGRHHSAASTGQTGPTDRSDRSTQNRKAAHSAHKCTTRQHPNLRVLLLDLPPLYIPADELDTAGAEVDVRVPWNNNCGNKPWVY